jgi:hypothetical protein
VSAIAGDDCFVVIVIEINNAVVTVDWGGDRRSGRINI